MKLTLRRAAQVQSELQRELSAIDLSTVAKFRLNPAADPVNQLAQAVAKFEGNLQLHAQLTDLLYRLRASVGLANSTTEVSGLLAQDAAIRSQQQTIASILSQRENTPSDDEWTSFYQMYLKRLQNSERSPYDLGDSNTLSASTLTAVQRTFLQTKLTDLKRLHNQISDQLLAINTVNTIEVDNQDWTQLQTLGLV